MTTHARLAEGWGHDAPVLLSVIATQTRRIRLGTGVLNIWGRSAAGPAMLARSLDAVSGRRFVLARPARDRGGGRRPRGTGPGGREARGAGRGAHLARRRR
jgi:hypothetical protein